MKTCSYCGAAGLTWHQNEDGSWSLVDGDAVHRCRPPKAKRSNPDEDGYIGEAKVRREMELRALLYGDGDE